MEVQLMKSFSISSSFSLSLPNKWTNTWQWPWHQDQGSNPIRMTTTTTSACNLQHHLILIPIPSTIRSCRVCRDLRRVSVAHPTGACYSDPTPTAQFLSVSTDWWWQIRSMTFRMSNIYALHIIVCMLLNSFLSLISLSLSLSLSLKMYV
jgi:hypothetical protein